MKAPPPAPGRPKEAFLKAPTPLMEHPELAARLGRDVRFFIKRDDIGELGGGGNKLRKLAYAIGAAKTEGADTLVTFGALQSNHARLTAAAAARVGMACELVLSRRVPRSDWAYEASGNVLLMKLFGARVHVLDAQEDSLARAEAIRERLLREGRAPYVIPFGGSDALGALGYAECAGEIREQLAAQGLQPRHVVVASGSGGTQAGLVAGFRAGTVRTEVHAISVLHPAVRLREIVAGLADQVSALLGVPARADDVHADDRFVGEGYGLPTTATLSAIRELAVGAGIILDPVYTGKAFAGLLAAGQEGRFRPGDCVVFVHTGGLPGLFAYAREFDAGPAVPVAGTA